MKNRAVSKMRVGEDRENGYEEQSHQQKCEEKKVQKTERNVKVFNLKNLVENKVFR